MSDFIVRYGVMRFLGVFSAPAGQSFRRGMSVIVRTERGLEAGDVLSEALPEIVGRLTDPPSGQIIRDMTLEDRNELSRIEKHTSEELDICQRYVDKLELKMQLVEVERIFGGERIVIYYLADNRVDFRELVRLLAGEFQTRIEMRQIGVRDEAKLLADYGDCGCPVCCNTHLVEMPPVSMRMAKLQKATLDPTKISGRCGRLKCCLRYEFDTYEEMQKRFPPLGATVITPEGPARVIGHEILSGQVQLLTEDNRRLAMSVDKIELDKNTLPVPEAPQPDLDSEIDEQVE
jgi:cell fate regulator YaaT (PSP1 superfamily)